ncbi:MAG TPA: 4Fe-4S dicluster domain-containing protein [bacterium]|jgi:ech hydrogenase subunit F|nr:4Fe-4S dicluster domain-containing protein [bacterium]
MAFGTFSLTALASLFKKPATTTWPATPYVPIPGTRGSLQFKAETCNYCTLCALKCPTGAIQVDRVKKAWTLDRFKCIVCAACVDACVKKALACDPSFSPPSDGHVIEVYRVAEGAESCAQADGEGSQTS